MSFGTEVFLWGTRLGIVVQEDISSQPYFMYDSHFIKSGIEVSPIVMPLSNQTYSFPHLNENTFHKLPGLLSDSLPDKFGTRVIEEYLAGYGRSVSDLTAVERLCYTGKRGMGALEFEPQRGEIGDASRQIDIDSLASLANSILAERKNVRLNVAEQTVSSLLQIGTSAGGARAKALIAWNEETGEIRSGQINAGKGFSYWLLKFGTIENNKDKDTAADKGEYQKIEYAYSLMAKDAGITMTECKLIQSEEGHHFATKRFDRDDNGRKIHMQTLGGLAHFDYNEPGVHSYEQTVQIMRKINLSQKEIEQFFRRMVFNEITKNYDDHVKNISFLMDKTGTWSLAPAYDITFSYRPDSIWTSRHQMTVNGKRENITQEDFLSCGRKMDISERRIKDMISDVVAAARKWNQYAESVQLNEQQTEYIKSFLRYDM